MMKFSKMCICPAFGHDNKHPPDPCHWWHGKTRVKCQKIVVAGISICDFPKMCIKPMFYHCNFVARQSAMCRQMGCRPAIGCVPGNGLFIKN